MPNTYHRPAICATRSKIPNTAQCFYLRSVLCVLAPVIVLPRHLATCCLEHAPSPEVADIGNNCRARAVGQRWVERVVHMRMADFLALHGIRRPLQMTRKESRPQLY